VRRPLAFVAVLLAGLVALGVAGAAVASAHASLLKSDPSDGQILDSSPDRIVLTFTEPPDLTLTTIGVVSSSGANVDVGPVKAGPAPRTAEVDVTKPLEDGVYTVTWRTVSTTDGHVTANAFTFGIGVEPGSVPTGGTSHVEETPAPSALSVAGKLGLYVGLSVLFGAGLGGLLVFGVARVSRRGVLIVAWALAAVGVVAMTIAERTAVGVPLGTLLSSDACGAFVRLAVAIVVVGIAVAVTVVRPSRGALLALAATTGGAMLVRAEGGHAGGSFVQVGLQWLHIAGVGAWIGGLVWLALGLRETIEPTAVKRFSNLATGGLVAVAITGLLRATNELGATWWLHPGRTGYSTALALKVLTFVPLVALGAANRFRNVPSYEQRGPRPLLRSVAGELALAVGIFGITGVLTGLPPKPVITPSTAPKPLVVTGSDFATTTKVRLTIAPGTVGSNAFVAAVTDYDTGKPVGADAVTLSFSLSGRPELASTLELEHQPSGTWQAGGTNLSVNGTWNVTALVQTGSTSVEVPLTLTPEPPQQSISVSRVPGQPVLYTITVQDGLQIQAYVDPGTPGQTNQVHVTAFDAGGKELPLRSATISTTAPDGTVSQPEMLRFGKGHFAANFDLTSGTWTFAITADARDGRTLVATFKQTFGSGGA
jgi:copper transport protein